MKRELKPFLVEVKRGTRRSSFAGHLNPSSPTSEAQRQAEIALFANPAAPAAILPKIVEAEVSGRILPSLVDPPLTAALPIEEAAPRRKERKPRSGNSSRQSKLLPNATSRRTAKVDAPPVVATREPEPIGSAGEGDAGGTYAAESVAVPKPERTRFRDRSSILARYVLKTEPAPGERWKRPSRRTARVNRTDMPQ